MSEWQLIETAPKPAVDEPLWIIGYTSWGQHVGAFHDWIGPCEWLSGSKQFQFANTDFDAFPLPTHWHPWPKPPVLRNET